MIYLFEEIKKLMFWSCYLGLCLNN